MRTHDPQPDLIAVAGLDSNGPEVDGYVRRGDLWRNDAPSTPAEALKRQADDHGRDVPVYAADGVTVVASFRQLRRFLSLDRFPVIGSAEALTAAVRTP